MREDERKRRIERIKIGEICASDREYFNKTYQSNGLDNISKFGITDNIKNIINID